jgi:hypothetical protein
MITSLCEKDTIIGNLIDEAVFLSDTSGPDTGTQVAEGFWLPDTHERIPADGFYQFENP